MRPAHNGWLEVRVWPPTRSGDAAAEREASERAALVAALVGCGSSGVIEAGASLIGYVPQGTDDTMLRTTLTRADTGVRIEVTPVIPADWSERWRDGVHAHEIGPLRITPPWLADAANAAGTVVIDPGMAFGTGEHASTRGVLRLLVQAVRVGDFVADLGAGSAVLAIAAAKLGARRVAAVELDPDAITNAEANVDRNGVSDRVCVIEGDAGALLPLLAPIRVVTANIVSSVIGPLLPLMRASLAPDGCAILGGILIEERRALRAMLDGSGWRITADDIEDEWWSALVEPR